MWIDCNAKYEARYQKRKMCLVNLYEFQEHRFAQLTSSMYIVHRRQELQFFAHQGVKDGVLFSNLPHRLTFVHKITLVVQSRFRTKLVYAF